MKNHPDLPADAPQWLRDADIEHPVWRDGIWRDGEWRGGIWCGGVWRGGEWRGGAWQGGEWRGGVWRDGEWRGGIWCGGVWRGGIWRDGEWRGGIWCGGVWRDGVWQCGEWRGGAWQGGEWRGGVWRDGAWQGGVWRDGVWQCGEWRGGAWQGGEWRGGVWRDGAWQGGVWQDGEWRDRQTPNRMLYMASLLGIVFDESGYARAYRTTTASGGGRYTVSFVQPEGEYFEEDARPAGTGTCVRGIHVTSAAIAWTYFGIDPTCQLWAVDFKRDDLLDCDGEKARIRGGTFTRIPTPWSKT